MPTPNPGGSPGKSWRGGKGPVPSERAKGGWTKKTDRTYEHAAARHRLKIAVWSLLLVALVAGFIIWLIWTPMRTPFLLAAVTDYAAPILPNAWASEDIQRFLALDKAEVLKCSEVAWQTKEQGLHQLCQELDSAKPGGPHRDLVIVYLSMHGAVDGSGEPCLLPPGAAPLECGDWLRVRDLLDELFVKDRPGKQPAGVKKLLVFDANRMDANWRLGMLYNAFADRLRAVVEEAAIPNLIVLNSASPGQIGWAAPELGGSAFGYFFWQGLKGAADVEEMGNGDRIVSLQELNDYLGAHVAQWVKENRADIQQPMLLAQQADWPLVYAQSKEKTSMPDPSRQDDPRWKDVASYWLVHDQLRQKALYRWNPLGWEEFQQKLLRLEQLLLAGKSYDKEYQDTRREVDALIRALGQDSSSGDFAVYSLPLVRQMNRWPSTEELQQLPAPWKKPAEPAVAEPAAKEPAKKPAEAGKAEAAAKSDVKKTADSGEAETSAKESAKKPAESAEAAMAAKEPAKKPTSEAAPPKPSEKPPEGPRYGYMAAAAESWNWFLEHPSRQRLPELLQFIDRGDQPPKADVVEILFLRMLNGYLDPSVWDAQSDPVRRALAVRNQAERAAAPPDERAWYWVRQGADQADSDRRLAEDNLFVGTPEMLKEAAGLWKKVADDNNSPGGYTAAIDRGREAATAFALRDQVLAESPYLAEWLLERLHASEDRDEQLRTLIENVRALGTEMDEAAKGGQWPPQLQGARQKTEVAWSSLQAAFHKECSSLVTSGEDRQTLRAIGSVLATPLLSGAQRSELREKYLRILKQKLGEEVESRQSALNAEPVRQTDRSGQAATTPFLVRLRPWREHPALMILNRAQLDPAASAGSTQPREGEKPRADQPEISPERQLKMLTEQGEQVRQLLHGVPAEADKRLAETARMLKQPAGAEQDPAAARIGRSQADRLVRAAAALLARRPWSDPRAEPAVLLRDLDRGFLLLWQAERALKDFWGPPPGRQESYFAVVAQSYLDSAKRLSPDAKELRLGKVDLPALLAARQKAARQGIQPKAADLSIVPDDPSSKNNMTVALTENLPKGEAAVYVQRGDGQILALQDSQRQPLRRMGMPVTDIQGPRRFDYLVPNDDRIGGANHLEAVAFYRGHVYSNEFAVVRSTKAVDIAFAPAEYRKPVITVYGQAWQRTSIMFIFDCSGSMYELVPLEGGRKEPRLKLARETLEAILQRLAASEKPYDVGMMVYGRRVGWNPAEGKHNEIVMRDPKNPDQFIPRPPENTIHPSDDVETILKIGPFTENRRLQVNRELDAIRPMGETPLYLSIIMAMREFPAGTAGTPRHIVVITDGFNEQSSGGPQGVLKFRKDVEDAMKLPGNKGIQLDIVAFDLTPKDKTEQQSLKDIQDLTAQTGGACYSAREPSELLKALEKSLGLLQYVVMPARGGSNITPQPLDLGKSCIIDQPPGRKASYLVKIVDPERAAQAEVAVEGGDAPELYLTGQRGGQWRLVHHRYGGEELRAYASDIPDTADPAHRVYIAAHLPEWQGSAVRFPISVQNADAEQFSPRPAEAWVRIKPMLPKDAGAGATYVFYDLNLEPGRPVPVLSCLAPNWPAEAKAAEIQVWLKFRKTEPDKVVKVGAPRPELKIDGAPDVAFEGEIRHGTQPSDPSRVVITERHPAGADVYNLKVEMSPLPRRVLHGYYEEVGIVRHSFLYTDAEAADLPNDDVAITSRKRLMEQAVTLPAPLQVTIPRSTIPVDR
jgi:hypothetical protein